MQVIGWSTRGLNQVLATVILARQRLRQRARMLLGGDLQQLLGAEFEAAVGIVGAARGFGEAGVVVRDEARQQGVGRLEARQASSP